MAGKIRKGGKGGEEGRAGMKDKERTYDLEKKRKKGDSSGDKLE